MTLENVLDESLETYEDLFTEDEFMRMTTLMGSVVDDARDGVRYPGYIVTHDPLTNSATWAHELDTVAVTVTARDDGGTFKIERKLWDEAGFDRDTTTVSIVGTEGRMSHSVVRNMGLVFEPEVMGTLDRKTYDATLGNLVDLKRLPNHPEVAPRRTPRFQWLRKAVRLAR
jgi:hypothetical protein